MWKQKIVQRCYKIDTMDDSREYESYKEFTESVTQELNKLDVSNCKSVQVNYIDTRDDKLAIITYDEINN